MGLRLRERVFHARVWLADRRPTVVKRWRRNNTPARRAWLVTVVGAVSVVQGASVLFGTAWATVLGGIFLLICGMVFMDVEGPSGRRRATR